MSILSEFLHQVAPKRPSVRVSAPTERFHDFFTSTAQASALDQGGFLRVFTPYHARWL